MRGKSVTGPSLNLPARINWNDVWVLQWHQVEETIAAMADRLSPIIWCISYVGSNDFLTIWYLNRIFIQHNAPCKDNTHYGVKLGSGWFCLLPSRYWRYAPFGDGPIMTIMYITAKQINLFRTDGTHLSSLVTNNCSTIYNQLCNFFK